MCYITLKPHAVCTDGIGAQGLPLGAMQPPAEASKGARAETHPVQAAGTGIRHEPVQETSTAPNVAPVSATSRAPRKRRKSSAKTPGEMAAGQKSPGVFRGDHGN